MPFIKCPLYLLKITVYALLRKWFTYVNASLTTCWFKHVKRHNTACKSWQSLTSTSYCKRIIFCVYDTWWKIIFQQLCAFLNVSNLIQKSMAFRDVLHLSEAAFRQKRLIEYTANVTRLQYLNHVNEGVNYKHKY